MRRIIYETALVIAAVVFLAVPPGQATAEESALPQPTSYVTVIAVPDYEPLPPDEEPVTGTPTPTPPPTPPTTTPPIPQPEPEPEPTTPPPPPGTVDIKDLLTSEGVTTSNIVVTTYVEPPTETPPTETPPTGTPPTGTPPTGTPPATPDSQQFAQVIIPAGTTVELPETSDPEEVTSPAQIMMRTVPEEDLEEPEETEVWAQKREPLPANSEGMAEVWQIEAGGIQFSQPIQVTLSYDEVIIPTGFTENDIIMITDDGDGWQPVSNQSTDAAENLVTAMVTHFSYFALIVYTTPADIGVRDLEVNPSILRAGEIVTVSVRLINQGDAGGEYAFSIQIEGGEEQRFSVAVDGRQSQIVTVSTARFEEGVYRVKAGDLERTFTVVGDTGALSPLTPPEARSFNYRPLIIGLAALVILFVGYLLYRRRRGGG